MRDETYGEANREGLLWPARLRSAYDRGLASSVALAALRERPARHGPRRMTARQSAPTPEVLEWLTASGWSPDRDIGEQAEELVRVRVRDAERQGVPLVPVSAALRAIRTYGMLRLGHPVSRTCVWVIDPTVGYDGDAAQINELCAGLGVDLFPVGYEASEFGILLVDEMGRWFHLHHTGGYYLGVDGFDAFSRFITGWPDPDAEDYFA
ncbi:SUKH-3 domain-containing protein [Streptomyces avermitilis]|uniref:SUKH-3 domain-containing protein n=1 Tax=Streptomyces avermitilis TaxID=33903 RepID=UPI00339DB9F2